MRVRSSPFGQSGPDAGGAGAAPNSMAVNPPGQGLAGAPTPAAGVLPPGSQVDFDSWDDGWADSQPRPQQVPQQKPQQMPQQMHQQMPQQMHQQMPQQMSQQGFSGQMPQQPQPMGVGMQQAATAMFAAGAGAGGGGGDMHSAMAGLAFNQLQQQFNTSGLARWFPTAFLSVQQLFSVGHSYVLRKLLLLLCPFLRRSTSQGAPASPGGWAGQQAEGSGPQIGPDGLMVDIDDPDLYIPFMSYVTYVLIYGIQQGVISAFKPEVLTSTMSFALVLLILEVGAFSACFYFVDNPVPAVKVAAVCGYKYVPVLLMVLVRIITGVHPAYYAFFAYLSACAAWSMWRFMQRFEPSQLREQYGVPTGSAAKHATIVMAALQIPVCWLLTPYATI